jgi:hypothetical protein
MLGVAPDLKPAISAMYDRVRSAQVSLAVSVIAHRARRIEDAIRDRVNETAQTCGTHPALTVVVTKLVSDLHRTNSFPEELLPV